MTTIILVFTDRSDKYLETIKHNYKKFFDEQKPDSAIQIDSRP